MIGNAKKISAAKTGTGPPTPSTTKNEICRISK